MLPQAEKVRELQARAPYLQELNDFRTKAGQNRELALDEPAQPEGAGVKYVSPTGKPVTPFPATAKEAAPLPSDKPEELATVQTAQTNVNAAQTALDEAVKTKDTTKIFGAVDALNQAQNTVARAQEDVGRPLLKPAVLDIFSPANLFKTAFENGDTKLLNDLASHADTTALRAALNQNLSEREKLINVLENRAGVGGDEKAIDPRTGEPGERLKSVKRERADLFAQLYDARQQALFKNGTYPDRDLQALYDKGGPAAVEYERVMQDVEDLSKKVTTKQGNAKKSLYEQLVDLAAQHAALVAQLESGVATPNLREKTAALQAKVGKGEVPAERQMDAKERFDLQRRIDTLVNKYRLTEGQIAPVRDQITKLYNSLYKTTPLEKTSKAADRNAAEAKERKERAKPLKEIADKFGMKSPEYKEALAKQVAESKAAGRVPKVAVSRTAKTAARLAKGDVRKEAETSKPMRDLAIELGQREPEYVRMQANAEKRLEALENKYGKGDPQVRAYSTQLMDALEAKAIGLGKATPEYKATLKEQTEYVRGALAQSKQTVPTKRTGQVTRKQSAAPSRLVTSSPESRAQTDIEDRAVRIKRGSLKDFQEALDSEKEGRDFLRGVETESVALNRDVVTLLEKGDVQGALRLVSKDPSVDKFSQAVAARLEPFLDVTKAKIENDLRSPEGAEVLGAATSKLIELNRNGGLSVETLLHEATHAAAERVVQLSETNPDALTKEQKLAINELKALHARVKNDKGITSKNAKSSLSEFVAEVMSNRNLQKQLAQRQWRLVDAWKSVKSIIMRMLGLQKVQTMFGASVVAVDQLFVPASAKVGKGRKETRVTRSLSAKDIAALDDGSNSMKQFAAQFGDLIKQKDRTPDDVERIGAQVIDDMLQSVSPLPRNTGTPRLKSEAAKLRAEHDAKSVVALPTADSLDYKGMVTMSDGKTYDENNPLHYVEATPATFAALEAMNNPQLREREAETIASQRKTDFLNLISYLMGNYENYTTVETALVLKAAAKYGVISGSNGRLKLVEIGKDNRHNVAVVGKETADAVIEQLRAGKGLKQAFLDGLQKNADDNAKNNERKNGWKKFEQANEDYTPNLYTKKEIDEATVAANITDQDIEDAGWDEETLVARLIEEGYLPDRQVSIEKAAIALNEGCAGTPWCTGASVGTARNQISEGDFYVYYNKGRPEVAVRMNGDNKIGEVRGNNPNQALDPAQQQIAADFLRAKDFESADKYLSEFERRETLIKRAKGEAPLKTTDLFDAKRIVNKKGEIDTFSMKRLLEFNVIDGYSNRPDPTDDVVNYFGKQYVEAISRAYENQEYIFADIDAKHAVVAAAFDIAYQGIDAVVVKTHAVDDGLLLGQAEQARQGVARLCFRGDGAHFDKAEAQRGQRINISAVFVQPGGQADGIGQG